MSDPPRISRQTESAEARKARLAGQLRANLRKRKTQARELKDGP